MDSIERRSIPTDLRLEQRSGSKRTLTGHAAIFDSLSQDLGGFQEKVSAGAFSESIKADDIRALIDHNPSLIIGRNRAGTLRLEEDRKGLRFEVDLGDTQAARDLATSVERGDVSQNSFSFRVMPDGQRWDEDASGRLIRTLTRVRLFDVSAVSFPAYEETDLSLRSAILAEGRRALGKGGWDWQVEADLRRRKLDLIVRAMDPVQRALYDIQLLRAQRRELQAKYGR